MASYNGNIDLLALNGAQVFTGIDQKNPKRAYVCIPADLNEIKFVTSQRDANKQIAGLRVNVWPLNEAYKNAVRRSAQERGDTGVNVPTHEMTMAYTAEYIKGIARQYPKLVEQVKEQNKDRDPDIVNQDAQDENSHLFKALRNRMNKRLAMMYQPLQTSVQTAYPQPSYQQAGTPAAYIPSADPRDMLMSNITDDSDLPF